MDRRHRGMRDQLRGADYATGVSLVSAHAKDGGPRLTSPAVTRVEFMGNRVRLVFNMRLSRADAMRYLWPSGAAVPVNFFSPDASDPMPSATGEVERFILVPHSSVIVGMRPDVYRQIYAAIPQSPGGVQLPTWLPDDVRQRITGALTQGGNASLHGAWPNRQSPRGVYWVQRTGGTTRVQAIGFGDPAQFTDRRRREAAETVNRDIAFYVQERGMAPREARAEVQRVHRRLLAMLLAGYLEAFMIYGGTNGGAGPNGMPHEALQ